MMTIRRQLLIYLFGGMISATLLAGFATYIQVRSEMGEMFDYQIKQIAIALPAELSNGHELPAESDLEDEIVMQIWDGNNQLVFTSAPTIQIQKVHGFGFNYTSFKDKKWRIYSELDQGRTIQISQPVAIRNHIAVSMALRSLIPFVILIPILALLIWVVVGRGLAPMQRLAKSISQRSPDALEPMPDELYPPELRPMFIALNGLLTRLDQARSAQRAFVSDAAHELRTPLAALKLQLQLVERENTDRKLEPGFTKLHERINRATHLVQQLLTLARQERQMPERTYKQIDLRELVARVVSDYTPHAEHKTVDLGVVTQDDDNGSPITIMGDEDNLRILLGNLVDNAVRYTPANGRVDVSASMSGGTALLRVADNGAGIPVEDHNRVFDRFYRREGTGESGSGLGLFIVKTIASQHHATIKLGTAQSIGGLLVTVCFQATSTSNSPSRESASASTLLRDTNESPSIS